MSTDRQGEEHRQRGRVEWQQCDPWQPYAVFDDDGRRLCEYDQYLRAVAQMQDSSADLASTAARLLRWQQHRWQHEHDGCGDLHDLYDLLAEVALVSRAESVELLHRTVTGYWRHMTAAAGRRDQPGWGATGDAALAVQPYDDVRQNLRPVPPRFP